MKLVRIGPKGRGDAFTRSVARCRARIDPAEQYLIARNGFWFRPNAGGYTEHLHDAGVYSAYDAGRYLDVESHIEYLLCGHRDYLPVRPMVHNAAPQQDPVWATSFPFHPEAAPESNN